MQQGTSAIEEKNQFFTQLLTTHQNNTATLQKKTTQYGTTRFVFFIVALVALVYFVNERNGLITFSIILGSPFIFGWLVNKHNSYKRRFRLSQNKVDVLSDELLRLKLDLTTIDGGQAFKDAAHPYATDMDVFGSHSLFALINRSKLTFGQETLASWFKEKAPIATIIQRQEAIDELSKEYDFLLAWWSENRMELHKKEYQEEAAFSWFEDSKNMSLALAWKIVPFIAVLQFWTVVALAGSGFLPSSFIAGSLFINLLLLAPIQQKVMVTQKSTDQLSAILNQHLGLFKLATTKSFKAKGLHELTKSLHSPSAPEKIKQLNKIMNWLHARNGMMYWIVDPLVMTDYWVLINALKWKKHYGKDIRRWFESIGKMEALLSIANFSFAHPHYVKPQLTLEPTILSGKEIGHPLIKHDDRVSNNFEMANVGSVSLITGSNMSGKSTFERSLGVNIILAQMGAVCCASELLLSPLQLFTSMRTEDNLSENTSSFYAELKRLKQLVDLTKSAPETPIFYLLDEILKGTNSEDRNKGAESLIKQLMKTNSLGLISTHDLSLAKLTEQLDLFANYSFNSEVKGEEILFDYKLHDGPCHTFNAVPLMRKMGIEIID
jgi:hypothetical protein